jgi:hypothetical protein
MKMSNNEDININKQIAVALAILINDYYGEIVKADTATLIKKEDNEYSSIDDLLNENPHNKIQYAYFLKFNNKEVKLPYGSDFHMYYQSFLIDNIIYSNMINYSKLKSLKLVIESFEK